MRAPAFTLPYAGKQRIRLTEWRGKWVVLMFLPRALSATCQSLLAAFQALHEEFEAVGSELLALCPQENGCLHQAARELNLAFPLLHDRDAKVASRYGVFRERRTPSRRYAGMVRATFLIDPSGHICHLWDNLRVDGHGKRVLARLSQELDILG